MAKITVDLTDEQVAHARAALPEGTTATQALAALQEASARAISDRVWAWCEQKMRESETSSRVAARAEHDALFQN